jgi:hypothetical protein
VALEVDAATLQELNAVSGVKIEIQIEPKIELPCIIRMAILSGESTVWIHKC